MLIRSDSFTIFCVAAVEALVQVQGSDDESLRLVAAQLLELLADVKSPEDMVDRRFDIGMDGLIHLSVVENEPVQVGSTLYAYMYFAG